MTGDKVAAAFPTYDMKGWGVSLKFNSEGAKQFGELTAANVKHQLAIVLDGKVLSAPVLNEAIYGGTASITGHFDEKSVRNLASALENPLQTPVKIEEERSVSASLGSDSIKSGVYAGIVGVLATFLVVALYYRFAGMVANIALIVNVILLFGVMSQFHFVLTLPGIAGIVLTIGIAIDANVLIYERLREELAAGKPLKAALAGAYTKAFNPIFDAHVTQILTSVILVVLASGPVRGFAVSLTVGIVCSLFSALLVTRRYLRLGLRQIRAQENDDGARHPFRQQLQFPWPRPHLRARFARRHRDLRRRPRLSREAQFWHRFPWRRFAGPFVDPGGQRTGSAGSAEHDQPGGKHRADRDEGRPRVHRHPRAILKPARPS